VTLIEVVLLLLAAAVALGLLANWCRVPYPILLVIGGLLLSLQPGAPQFDLDPNLVFLLFLPPLLYAAAFGTHWRAFRAQLRAISLLAVGLVLFTMTVVAVVAHEFVGMHWASAFVLGAVVSPPDAVAAVAITRRMKVSRIVTTVLEGESLVNDATALVAFRIAVGFGVAGVFSLVEARTQFVIVSVGGIAVGFAGALVALWVYRFMQRSHLADTKLFIAATLLTPFAVYLPAEHLHVSGVLATVTCGLWVGTRCERVFPREVYREAKSVWEMMEFLLNSLIFILIGFHLPVVLNQLDDRHSPLDLLWYAVAISAAVIVARLVWMFPGAYVPRWIDAQFGRPVRYPPWQNVIVVGWTGMRGVVSLATALAVPLTTATGSPFPDRPMILFLTFWVIFATLVGQGLTLPLVMRLLRVDRFATEGNDLMPDVDAVKCEPPQIKPT
jgi:Na+/H+ antiporter